MASRQEIDEALHIGRAEMERLIPFLKEHKDKLQALEDSKGLKFYIAHIAIHPELHPIQEESLNTMRLASGYGFMLGCEEQAKILFEELICPMCYRLNPHHATANNGTGCKSCQDKEEYCGTTERR